MIKKTLFFILFILFFNQLEAKEDIMIIELRIEVEKALLELLPPLEMEMWQHLYPWMKVMRLFYLLTKAK